MKKIISVLLAVAMLAALTVPAFALRKSPKTAQSSPPPLTW